MSKILKPFTTKEQWLEYFQQKIKSELEWDYDTIEDLLEEFDQNDGLYDIDTEELGWVLNAPLIPILKDKLSLEAVEKYLEELKTYKAFDHNKVKKDMEAYENALQTLLDAQWELVYSHSGYNKLSKNKKELVMSFLFKHYNEARHSFKETYKALCEIVELAKPE